jgi:alanine dehydrogenase
MILGGGTVGINAAKMAAGLGAHVTILDISLDRLRYLDDVLPPTAIPGTPTATIFSRPRPGPISSSAPFCYRRARTHLLRREDLKLMKQGAVIVDVAVDQADASRPSSRLRMRIPRISWTGSFTTG